MIDLSYGQLFALLILCFMTGMGAAVFLVWLSDTMKQAAISEDEEMKNPSGWEEPPEDRTNECRKCGELYADMTGFCAKCQQSEDTDLESDVPMLPNSDYTIELEPSAKDLEKECDYWTRVT